MLVLSHNDDSHLLHSINRTADWFWECFLVWLVVSAVGTTDSVYIDSQYRYFDCSASSILLLGNFDWWYRSNLKKILQALILDWHLGYSNNSYSPHSGFSFFKLHQNIMVLKIIHCQPHKRWLLTCHSIIYNIKHDILDNKADSFLLLLRSFHGHRFLHGKFMGLQYKLLWS